MQTLTVVNNMLGTMGESPLNTLEDSHSFRGACLSTLNDHNRAIQAEGWWFNMERITLDPQVNGRISIPGDAISIRTPKKSIVQRGRYLYNTDGGSITWTTSLDVEIIRLVSFEELPETAAQHIAAQALLFFQTTYDGDSTKTRQLREEAEKREIAVNTEHIRNCRTNLIDSNYRLQRLKAVTNAARRFIR